MPGSKVINHDALAHKWFYDWLTRPNMRIKVGRMSHDIRILGRIVGVRSTEQSVWHLLTPTSFHKTNVKCLHSYGCFWNFILRIRHTNEMRSILEVGTEQLLYFCFSKLFLDKPPAGEHFSGWQSLILRRRLQHHLKSASGRWDRKSESESTPANRKRRPGYSWFRTASGR